MHERNARLRVNELYSCNPSAAEAPNQVEVSLT